MARMISKISQFWLRRLAPTFRAMLTRVVYCSSNMMIGTKFRADGVPRILLDRTANIEIGCNVEFRRGVELRAHGNARITIENDVRIDRGVRILASNNAHVRIRKGCRIGLYSVLNGGDDIEVGEDTLISGFVYLQTSQHRFQDKSAPIAGQGYSHGPVVVESGSWLAAHVVIMPDVTIGACSVVASNAVVTKSVQPGLVVGGVPARALDYSQDHHV